MRLEIDIMYNFKQALKKLEGKGKHMRHIKFFVVKDIKEKELIKLIKATQKGYQDPHPKKKPSP